MFKDDPHLTFDLNMVTVREISFLVSYLHLLGNA